MPVWALFGVSWNILSGYGGQLSFGHASFFGIGAYTVTLAVIYWSLSPWLGIPLGMLLGGLAAILIGFPTFRLRGHYFALSMLAYPLAILYVMQYLGFQEVSMPMHREHALAFMEFSEPRIYTLLAVLLLVGGVVVSLVIENSRFGLALLAIRQNELAAEAAGINARREKMRSLVVSGMMAAVVGGFYARVLLVVTPDSVFGMLVSAQAVVVTLFGGVASVWGPVIGAAILIPLAETLQAELGTYLPGIQGVVYGVAIIAVMLLSPDGLFWTIRDRWFRGEAPQALPDLGPDARRLPPPRHRAPAHASGPLLHVESLSRAFGGLKAVSEVSFSVAEGEILGIIGPNGAGKTTLFNVLNGVLAADAGSARLDGQPMLGKKTFEVCRMGVGRTFQVVRSFPRLPVLDNVIVGAYGTGAVGPGGHRPGRAGAPPGGAARPVGRGRRPAHQQAAPPDGAGARAGRQPPAAAAGRDAGWPGPRGVRRRAGGAGAAARTGHDDLHHRAYNARDDAPRRPLRGAGPRPGARHRAAARRRRGRLRDRGLSRQEMAGSPGCLRSRISRSPTAACAPSPT